MIISAVSAVTYHHQKAPTTERIRTDQQKKKKKIDHNIWKTVIMAAFQFAIII